MAKIMKFPKQPESKAKIGGGFNSQLPNKINPNYIYSVIKAIWVLGVLVWPILKWIVSIDCVFQFIHMLYFWNSAGHYAGANFISHFLLLTFLTYFFTIYKPKGI